MPIHFLGLLAGALLASAEPQEREKAPEATKKLWAAISVSHPVYVPREQGELGDPFMIRFGLVNDGNQVVDPDLDASQLLINGKPLPEWRVIIGNGPEPKNRHALPPGQRISFGYEFGRHFTKPGIYKVVWKGKGFESPEIIFRVLPTGS